MYIRMGRAHRNKGRSLQRTTEERVDDSPSYRDPSVSEEIIELQVPVECYSRVVGYLRPTSSWNTAKQLEFADRKEYLVEGVFVDEPVATEQG